MKIFVRQLTGKEFLKTVTPATLSLLFISFYTIVDGVFVGYFVGENALAAINIVFPILTTIFAFSVMLGSGGSAFVGAMLGAQKPQRAREIFSLIIVTGLIISFTLMLILFFTLEPLVYFLGSSELLFEDCYQYAFVLAVMTPFIIHKDILEIFLRTDGKAIYSLWLAFFCGILNIFFDYLFIVEYQMGLVGAAWATGSSFIVPSIISTVYFALKKNSLYFVKPVLDWKMLWATFMNGASEMITRLSSSFVTFLLNIITMQYLGEAGVAAISIILYTHFLMVSVYMGFSFGCSPLISYNHGAGNKEQLKKIMQHSKWFILLSSVSIFACAQGFAPYIVGAFVGTQTEVFLIATEGMKLYSICFLFEGFNIFMSAMFTAFGNGKISAVISFLHSFVFVFVGILTLPQILSTQGIWLTLPVAELLTLILSGYCFYKYKVVYNY